MLSCNENTIHWQYSSFTLVWWFSSSCSLLESWNWGPKWSILLKIGSKTPFSHTIPCFWLTQVKKQLLKTVHTKYKYQKPILIRRKQDFSTVTHIGELQWKKRQISWSKKWSIYTLKKLLRVSILVIMIGRADKV